MESLDILILGVEASIALAGFAGVIATFQFGGDKETRRADAVGLTMILQFSLLAALASSTAILLYSFDVKESTMWGICSVLLVAIFAWAIHVTTLSLGKFVKGKSLKRLSVIFRSIGFSFMLILVMNALDIFFHREPGPVIGGIIWALVTASYMFSRLLLRPVWRNVRKQEAAKLADATSG